MGGVCAEDFGARQGVAHPGASWAHPPRPSEVEMVSLDIAVAGSWLSHRPAAHAAYDNLNLNPPTAQSTPGSAPAAQGPARG